MKLHQIMIGLVLIGMLASGLTIFISDAGSYYAPGDFDEENMQTYDSMSNLSYMMEGYEENSSKVNPESTDDLLGSLFTSSYQSAQTLKQSSGVMKNMVDDSIGNNELLGGFAPILRNGLIIIIGIAISVGIFLHFITKSNRT